VECTAPRTPLAASSYFCRTFVIMLQWLVRLFGSKRERDIARLRPIVSQINQHYAALRDLSDADLRAQTTRLRQTIQAHLRPLMEKKARIESDLQAALKANDIPTQVRLYEELDQLRLERNRKSRKSSGSFYRRPSLSSKKRLAA
jgi:hypothetical protein